MNNTIFSIGHSTLSLESFISLLRQHRIDVVCDVRSQPYSRVSPHFSRDMIRRELERFEITYAFFGNELGARVSDPSLYVDGKVSYNKLAGSDLFKRGLHEIQELASNAQVAMMCAEREPLACHRSILVSRYLQANGDQVAHILGTGDLETHENTMNRLLRTLGLHEADMFKSQDEILAEAYTIQGDRIAYDSTKQPHQLSAFGGAKAR